MSTTSHTVKSVNDLKSLFTELPMDRSKFKTKVQQLFDMGFSFDVLIADDGHSFKSKSGKQYKAALKGGGRTFLVKMMYKFYESGAWKYYSVTWADVLKAFGKMVEKDLVDTEVCSKCRGKGVIPGYEQISQGLCFACGGVGKWPKLAKNDAEI